MDETRSQKSGRKRWIFFYAKMFVVRYHLSFVTTVLLRLSLLYFHITHTANVLHYNPLHQRSKVTDTLRKKILMNPTRTWVMLMMMRKMRMREVWLRRTEIQTTIPRVHWDRRGAGLGTAGRNTTTLPTNRQETEKTMSNTSGTRKGKVKRYDWGLEREERKL